MTTDHSPIPRQLWIKQRCIALETQFNGRIGREHWLRLRALPLRDANAWLAQYERFWNQRLDALGDFLERQKDADDERP